MLGKKGDITFLRLTFFLDRKMLGSKKNYITPFRGKRGDITFQEVAYALLALLILILLLIIFRKQVGDLFGGLGGIINDVIGLVGEIK